MSIKLSRPLAVGWSLLLSQELVKHQPITAHALHSLEKELHDRVREAAEPAEEWPATAGWSLDELREQRALGAVMDLVLQRLPMPPESGCLTAGTSTWSVLVADNFDPESTAYCDSWHSDPITAVVRCRSIVDACLQESFKPDMRASELLELYEMFGEEPFVVGSGAPFFSGRDYARQRSGEICAPRQEST
ncbi:hypothetical protein AEP_00080 [Curvibacter sp. AEP1-3]|uniref:hypothetical protein n=1 Tax=Curvibacter sp. AEP1-3 TaxID=1844971 RepID=UPI000B3C980C|nr:hypothetical protein [Curvibacter sp. AEP1-3]ARV17046.1 hypothetical protein AEP_00080 [Curvibacter sp. AEP1-3]